MVPVISILPLSSNSPFNICSVTEDRTPLNISTESTILSFLSRGHWRGIGGGKTISCYFLLLYSGVSNLAAFAWPGDKLLSSPLNVETDPKLFCSHWYPESLLTLQLTPPSQYLPPSHCRPRHSTPVPWFPFSLQAHPIGS